MADPKLMHIFNFNAQELAANREGGLSVRQQETLKALERDETTSLLFGLGILGFIGALGCGLCAALFNIPVILRSSWELVLLGIIGGVVALVAVFYANWRGARERDEQGDVVTLSGVLDFQTEVKGSRERYYLVLEGRRFPVSAETYGQLQVFHHTQPGSTIYNIHYTPKSRHILSVEAFTALAE